MMGVEVEVMSEVKKGLFVSRRAPVMNDERAVAKSA